MFLLMTIVALFADGVVFESRPLEYHSWRWAFRQQGIELTKEQFKEFIGLDRQELTEHFYNHFGCGWDPSVFDLQAFEYGNIFSKGITPKEGVAELIKRLPNYCLIEFTILTDQLGNYVYLTDSGVVAKKLSALGYPVFGLRTEWTSDDDFSSCIKVFDSILEIEPQELWLE